MRLRLALLGASPCRRRTRPPPGIAGAKVEGNRVQRAAETWAFPVAPGDPEHVELEATVAVLVPARRS